jgi:hypothetical protein
LVESTTAMKCGVWLPKKATMTVLSKVLQRANDTSFYFNNLLHSSAMDKEDGTVTGKELMQKIKERKKNTDKTDAVRDFIAEHRAVGVLAKKYSFIEPLLCAVVKSSLRNITNVDMNAECCGPVEGKLIGQSLAISLATNLTAETGEIRQRESCRP